MISTPEFVYEILNLLLIENINVNEILEKHFFACDKRAYHQSVEKHIIDESGTVLVNSKYNVCFHMII